MRDEADALSCPGGERFPVVRGIPRFVAGSTYADAFGEQWKKHRRTQLDSVLGTSATRDRLRRCLGDAVYHALAGTQVLEGGCGAGRFTEVLLAEGAQVTSVDLSTAVEANQGNFPIAPNHRIAQADIQHLPFAARQFDVVVCLGVIQHTPRPESTIKSLYEQVRPGGWLVIDHYPRSLGWFLSLKPVYRAVLRRLPPGRGLQASEFLVRWFLPLHRAVRRHALLQSLLARFSPVFQYYREMPELSDEAHRELAVLDTHDGLTDWYKHRRSPAEIRRVLENLEATDIWCEPGGNGVEARARRPPLRDA